MATQISDLSVRRCALIKAAPERIWQEFESLERMKRWYGLRHTLTKFEPKVGGTVETRVEHEGNALMFTGKVLVFDPPRELTFEQDWVGHGWAAPSLITIRLTPSHGGTLVELFHHGYERLGGDPGELHRSFEGSWTNEHLEALREIVEA